MAHYVMYKEMDAIQWDGDNYETIEKVFGKDWILGKVPESEATGPSYTGKPDEYCIRLKTDRESFVRLVFLGNYVCRYKGEDTVFEMKRDEFERAGWLKDYEYRSKKLFDEL